MYKTYMKNEAKGLRAITFAIAKLGEKIFNILNVPILFSPPVNVVRELLSKSRTDP